MHSNVTAIMQELKECNSMYHGFVFNAAALFLDKLVDDPDMAPKTADDMPLFSAGQGFITGYGAALDDDYDVDATGSLDVAEFSLAIGSAGEMSEWQVARTARFARAIRKNAGTGPTLYYATYGFAKGLLQGLDDKENGKVDTDKIASIDDGLLHEICEDAVVERVEEAQPYIMFIAGDGTAKKPGKVRKSFDSIANAVLKNTEKYVATYSSGASGFNDTEPQVAYNRAYTYAGAFLDGFTDKCMREFDAPGDYDIEDLPDVALEPMGIFDNIDNHYDQDLKSAAIAKGRVADMLEDVLENDYDADLYDDYDELPDLDDAFWHIIGIGYADGVAYASKKPHLIARMDEKDHRRLDGILESAIAAMEEEAQYLESFFGEDGDLTPEFKAQVEAAMEANIVENENGERVVVVGEDFYRQIGWL